MQSIYRTVSAEAAAHLQIRRGILAALTLSLITNAALALTLLTRTDESRTVVLAPDATTAYIASNDAVSANLLERFAAESAGLLLNTTPATVSNRAEAFLKNVAPASYGEIAAGVRRGAAELTRNFASSVFYPETSAVDETARAVCFNGKRRMMIATAVTEEADTTVCLRHIVSGGRLQISQLTLHRARTQNAAQALSHFLSSSALSDMLPEPTVPSVPEDASPEPAAHEPKAAKAPPAA